MRAPSTYSLHQARPAGEAVAAHARERFVPRDEDRDEIRHRGAGSEDYRSPFQGSRRPRTTSGSRAVPPRPQRGVAAADVGVHARGEQRRDDPGRRSGAVHPAEESRMTVVDRVRRDALEERRVHVRQDRTALAAADRRRSRRESRAESGATAAVRECPRPHRTFHRARAMRERAQFRPIARIGSPSPFIAKISAASPRRGLNVCCGSTASR